MKKLKTMNDLYKDGSNHKACEKCGFCITCKDCECNKIQQPKMKELWDNKEDKAWENI